MPTPDWYDGAVLDDPGPGRFLLTTRRYPIFYLQITKCGCTFLRNLVYFFDHDALHPDSGRIHAHEDDFLKAGFAQRSFLHASPYLFAVVRDPIDRFFSLYFDKLANPSNDHDAGMRRRVTNAAGLTTGDDLSIKTHRENCLKTLNWFDLNLSGKAGKPNPHWQRQSVRLARIKNLEPQLLTLTGLSWQLPMVLSPLIPDIAAKMAAVRVRNASEKPFGRAEILTPEIAASVMHVYPGDSATYARVSALWGNAPLRSI